MAKGSQVPRGTRGEQLSNYVTKEGPTRRTKHKMAYWSKLRVHGLLDSSVRGMSKAEKKALTKTSSKKLNKPSLRKIRSPKKKKGEKRISEKQKEAKLEAMRKRALMKRQVQEKKKKKTNRGSQGMSVKGRKTSDKKRGKTRTTVERRTAKLAADSKDAENRNIRDRLRTSTTESARNKRGRATRRRGDSDINFRNKRVVEQERGNIRRNRKSGGAVERLRRTTRTLREQQKRR